MLQSFLAKIVEWAGESKIPIPFSLWEAASRAASLETPPGFSSTQNLIYKVLWSVGKCVDSLLILGWYRSQHAIRV